MEFLTEATVNNWMSYVMLGCAVIAAYSLQTTDAEYGRYTKNNGGSLVNAKVAWMTQEVPAFLVPVLMVLRSEINMPTVNLVLLGTFIAHYAQRSFLYPMLIRGGKPFPFFTVAAGICFCTYNGYMQGLYLIHIATYPDDWITGIRFRLGLGIFILGMLINLHSDHILRNLRKPGETGYKIPRGGMFEHVSGANYFGEIVEWFGYAIACWSLPAFAFFVFTATNTGLRGYSHHRWYLQHFEDYPKSRRAIIPFIW